MLSPTEWADSFFDQGVQIRAGERRNGQWHVLVEQDGEYEFVLRRWAREVDVPMRAGLPAHQGEIGQYPAGVALPVAKATLQAAGRRFTRAIGADDREAVFTMPLQGGPDSRADVVSR